MTCPKCGSANVDVQLLQENQGSTTLTKTKSKYKEKGHSCLWWICIGWWWWFVDAVLWLCFFVPRLLIKIFKKKKYTGESTSASTTKNKIAYKSVCLCKDCGHHWEA